MKYGKLVRGDLCEDREGELFKLHHVLGEATEVAPWTTGIPSAIVAMGTVLAPAPH